MLLAFKPKDRIYRTSHDHGLQVVGLRLLFRFMLLLLQSIGLGAPPCIISCLIFHRWSFCYTCFPLFFLWLICSAVELTVFAKFYHKSSLRKFLKSSFQMLCLAYQASLTFIKLCQPGSLVGSPSLAYQAFCLASQDSSTFTKLCLPGSFIDLPNLANQAFQSALLAFIVPQGRSLIFPL